MLEDFAPPLEKFKRPVPHGVRAAVRQAQHALAEGDLDAARMWVQRALVEAPNEPILRGWLASLAPTPEAARAAGDQAERPATGVPPSRERGESAAPPEPPASPTGLRSHHRVEAGRESALASGFRPMEARSYPWLAGVITSLVVIAVGLAFLTGAWLVGQGGLPAALAAELPGPSARNARALLIERADELWILGQEDAALAVLAEAHRQAPNDTVIRAQLAQRHAARAAQHLDAGAPDQALPHLQTAIQLAPNESAYTRDYQTLLTYLDGKKAYEARDWDKTIEILAPLFERGPEYADARALLGAAYAGLHEADLAARAEADRALISTRRLQPGRAARAALLPSTPVNKPGQTLLPPMLPTLGSLSNKHVVVSINAQRMYVYENGQLIWNWIASTGEPERPTIPGRYRVQDKIPNARSNVWSLWMPYWLGIYWAGSVENGIHGQVTFDRGGRLWEGALGTRITFGCVMISDENAKQLYEWAEIGTPVSIHWDWDPSWIPDANGDPIK